MVGYHFFFLFTGPANINIIVGMYRGHEQWGQCDACSKWRKLPMDVFLPSKWTCSDNVWDPSRYFLISAYVKIENFLLEIFSWGWKLVLLFIYVCFVVCVDVLLGVHVLHQWKWVIRNWRIFFDLVEVLTWATLTPSWFSCQVDLTVHIII